MTPSRRGGLGSARPGDQARKVMADIMDKHMKPVYRQISVGTCKGYSVEIVEKSMKIRDGYPEGEIDPGKVGEVILWDRAVIDAQKIEYRKALEEAKEAKARADAEKKKREEDAALDY